MSFRPVSRLFIWAMPLVLCGGCEKPYPASPPSPASLVGEYEIAGDSELVQQFGRGGRLELRADGNFVMKNVPGWDFSGPQRMGHESSGSGKWMLLRRPGDSRGMPPYLVELQFDGPKGQITFLPYVWGRESPWQIRISIGDPDNGRIVVFQRVRQGR